MSKTLDRLSNGEQGRIISINGGRGVRSRLEAMGVREGKELQKVSAQMFRGPVTIMIDGGQIALGHGIARKIIIEIT